VLLTVATVVVVSVVVAAAAGVARGRFMPFTAMPPTASFPLSLSRLLRLRLPHAT